MTHNKYQSKDISLTSFISIHTTFLKFKLLPKFLHNHTYIFRQVFYNWISPTSLPSHFPLRQYKTPSVEHNWSSLSPCTADLYDGETSMHIWTANHLRLNKPNLVLVHGYGGNSKWQFVLQVVNLNKPVRNDF